MPDASRIDLLSTLCIFCFTAMALQQMQLAATCTFLDKLGDGGDVVKRIKGCN